MKQRKPRIRDVVITLGILALCFVVSLLLQDVFEIPEQVTTSFAFAVFLVSLLTDGYTYGLIAPFASVLLVNYFFTNNYPIFKSSQKITE